jgi:hypothetical protein
MSLRHAIASVTCTNGALVGRLFEEVRVQALPQSQRASVFSIFAAMFDKNVKGVVI